VDRAEAFNRGIVLLLARLAEASPVPILLAIESLDPDADAATQEVYAATAEYLIREGYMVGRSIASNADLYQGAALTARGLELMRSTPPALKQGPTVLERIRGALSSGSRDAIVKAGSEILVAIGKSQLPGS